MAVIVIVIVINPGHGGTENVGDSSPNNATSPSDC
jgi:hypothetical protein